MDNQKPQTFFLKRSWTHLIVSVIGALLAIATVCLLPISQTALLMAIGLIIGVTFIACWRAKAQGRDDVISFVLFRRESLSVPMSEPMSGLMAGGDAATSIRLERDPLSITLMRASQTPVMPSPAFQPVPCHGMVHRGSVVTPWFVSILYRQDNDHWWRWAWPHVISVWPDSMPSDDFRRLRVLLKWG